MATCGTTPSSLMLTYAATPVHPQDLTPSLSLLSFKPSKTAAFSLCTNLSVRGGERRASKWLDLYPLRQNKNGPPGHMLAAASAVEADTDLATDDVEDDTQGGAEGATAIATATATISTKPKKGKAALPLKRDRVFAFVSVFLLGYLFSFSFFLFVLMFSCSSKCQTRSKRFLEIQNLREGKKEYDLKTAISLLKQMSSTKFTETAEAHFRLNIDPKYNDQQLRATVSCAIFLTTLKDYLCVWSY